ncbi:MAG: hypothetical protein AAGA58_15750 [Verrucomicrobiota bacterium]
MPKPTCLLILILILGQVPTVFAQSAKEAIGVLHRTKGANAVRNIVAMRGLHGQDQPGTWEIITNEPSLREQRAYQISNGRLSGEGRMTGSPRSLVLNPSKLRLDSTDAFRIANAKASEQYIGFDAIDYELRAVDYSYSPVWRVTLRNASGAAVGRMEISAETGNVRWPTSNSKPRQTSETGDYLVSTRNPSDFDGNIDYASYEDRDYWSDRDMDRAHQRNYLWWKKSTDGLQYAGHNIKEGFRETGAAFRDIFQGEAVFRSTGKKRNHVRKAAHTRPAPSNR